MDYRGMDEECLNRIASFDAMTKDELFELVTRKN